MKKLFLFNLIALFVFSSNSQAANIAVIATPPGFLSVAIFFFAVASIVIITKVLGLVKGGLLSKSWQFFMYGFVVLSLSQIAQLLNITEVFILPSWISTALLVLMAVMFFFGIFETRRTLG